MERVRFAEAVVLDPAVAEAGLVVIRKLRKRLRRGGARDELLGYVSQALWSRLAGAACGGGPVVLGKEAALDVAAGLLVAADALHATGRHLEAFALEGLQGRVMEAALGPG